jgi:hypothetical protein
MERIDFINYLSTNNSAQILYNFHIESGVKRMSPASFIMFLNETLSSGKKSVLLDDFYNHHVLRHYLIKFDVYKIYKDGNLVALK